MSLGRSPSRSLSRPELQRYSRQLLVPELANIQERLQSSVVLVVGAGGLGCPVISYLAGVGVGTLRISDHDSVSLSNLHRQTLYTTGDVGRPKAQVAAARAQQINPYVRSDAAPAFSHDTAAALLRGVHLVIDASDNFATRYLINDCCKAAGLPWVWGAASGLEGMVSVFDQHFGLSEVFAPSQAAQQAPDCNVVGVLGPLLGVVGGVMATEAIKRLGAIDSGLYLKLWSYDALSAQTRLITLKKPSVPLSSL